jgi:uncharacterized protein
MPKTRQESTFSSGGETCAAWLYPVLSDPGPRPIIVMAHGLTGTRRDRLNSFAERFAAGGITALVFDHRGFGDSTGEPDLFDPARQLEDWRSAIAFARSLPNIDRGRVATFGSSLGGGNALAAAAEDPLIAAAISQVPFLDMSQAFANTREVAEKMHAVAAERGFLPAVGQPNEAAFINAPGAEAGWRRVVAIGDESRWRNRVSAAWLLESPYHVIQHADSLHCPWLVCVAGNDQVATPALAIDAARRAPKGELCIYPDIDHFDIYDGPPHEAVVADELAFLSRHLLGRTIHGIPKAGSVFSRVYVPPKSAAQNGDGHSEKVSQATSVAPDDGVTALTQLGLIKAV